MSKEEKKPSLRKAADADLHPSTPIQGESTLRLRGANTADSVGAPDKDKPVILEVQIPKSLRKAIRKEAKRRNMTVDEIVADALRNR